MGGASCGWTPPRVESTVGGASYGVESPVGWSLLWVAKLVTALPLGLLSPVGWV